MYQKLNEHDVTLEILKTIKPKIKSLKKSAASKTCFLGFDGYIDSLYHIVQIRKNSEEWTRMENMKTFGELAISVAGSSANVERVLVKRIFGGFAPNTSRALNNLGVRTYLVAALGYPELHKLFEQNSKVQSYSITNPGETMGLEFTDGKIMITDFKNIYTINWELLLNIISKNQLIENIMDSDVLGFGHWALIPSLNNIWNKFLEEIFPSIKNLKEKLFFVDIADIRKRGKSDILELFNLLQKIDEQIPVMLSVNDQEAKGISKLLLNLDIKSPSKNNFKDYFEIGRKINQEVEISYFVIHSPHFATISTLNDHFWVTEAYTSKPKVTTAGGDHFHSGTALSLSCDLSPAEAILIGNVLSAIFVRTGISPNFDQMSQFIDRYIDYLETDIQGFP